MQRITDTHSTAPLLTAGQLNRLDDECASLRRLLHYPEAGASFERIIDACNALRYACLNTHDTPSTAAAAAPTVAECIAQLDTWNGRLEAAIDHQALEQLGQHANDDVAQAAVGEASARNYLNWVLHPRTADLVLRFSYALAGPHRPSSTHRQRRSSG